MNERLDSSSVLNGLANLVRVALQRKGEINIDSIKSKEFN
jgi:hypothetical protein